MHDLVLLHPGGENMAGLQGPFFPIGWLGIASLIRQHGLKVAIVNCFLERLLQPTLQPESLLATFPARIYGIDIHWFVHAYEGIALAERVRQACPQSKIVVGGLTASVFAEEILEHHPCIDAVVRGEGEWPLLRYCQEVTGQTTLGLGSVPNLSYRQGAGGVASNPIRYVAGIADLDALDFVDFSPVLHFEELFSLNNADYVIDAGKSTDPSRYYAPGHVPRNWAVYTGRGCHHACSFCGGSGPAFARAFGRTALTLRSPERVARDVVYLAKELGVQSLYFPHSPLTTSAQYHHALLDAIQRTAGRLKDCGFFFEDAPFFLDTDVLDKYLRIFSPDRSVIRLYVVDHTAEVCRRNKFAATCEVVDKLHRRYRSLPVLLQTAVLVGLPGQNRETAEATAEYLWHLQAHECGLPLIYTAEMHPGSVLQAQPQTSGISQQIDSFEMLYRHLRDRTDKAMFLGYHCGTPGDAEQQRHCIEQRLHGDELVVCMADRDHPGDDPQATALPADLRARCSPLHCWTKRVAASRSMQASRVVFCGRRMPAAFDMIKLVRLCFQLGALPVIRVAETGLHDLRYLGCAARDGAIRVEVVRADASEAPEFAQATQDDMRYLTDNGVQVEALASASMACECIHAQR